MNPILNLTKVEVSYLGFHLGPLDLSIPRGVVVGYIGESGSGKTTTIKAILGLKKIIDGKIEIFGEEMNPNTFSQFGKIGVVFDQLFLPDNMYIYEVDKLCSGLYMDWDTQLFVQFCRNYNLDKNARVEQLSKGMKMKLAFAMALSHKPELLILDEPTSGLDPASREEFLDLILEFMQDPDHSVLISSHILSDLEKVADYIAFIHNGQFLFMEQSDLLQEKYGLWKGAREDFDLLREDSIVRVRQHNFAVEALVLREKLGKDIALDKPTIEEIMIFYIRGDKLK